MLLARPIRRNLYSRQAIPAAVELMDEEASPPSVAAAAPRNARARMLISLLFALGIVLLAVSAAVFAAGNVALTSPTQDQINNNLNLQNVWSPVLWNIGMLLILVGVFGAAAMFGTMDPIARILLWIVALIAVLMILTGGVTLFK